MRHKKEPWTPAESIGNKPVANATCPPRQVHAETQRTARQKRSKTGENQQPPYCLRKKSSRAMRSLSVATVIGFGQFLSIFRPQFFIHSRFQGMNKPEINIMNCTGNGGNRNEPQKNLGDRLERN